MKKLKWIFLVIILFLALTLSLGNLQPAIQSDTPAAPDFSSSTGKWEFQPSADGKSSTAVCSYDIPSYMNAKAGIIYFRSTWKNYSLSVDGETLYSHSDHMDDGYAHLIYLPESTADTLTFYFEDVKPIYQKNVQNIQLYIGTSNDISLFLLHKNMYAVLFGCITFLLGLAAVITSLFLRKALPKELFEGIIWLGIYILAAMVWVVTDSTLLLLFTGNTYLINFISFLSFFLMPFSMLEFTTKVMPGKKDVFLLLEILNLLLLLIYLINRFFMVIPVILLLICIHLLIITTMAQSLWQGFHELRKEKNPRLFRVLLGYIFLSVFTGIALLLFYHDDNICYSQLYIIGMSGYIFFLIDGVAIGLYNLIKENANTALYAKLAYLDIMTNMLNRTAFIADQESDQVFHGSMAYIMIDANNLKVINDTFGHEKGDLLIMEIAACIQQVSKNRGKCYRIGGDEFVIALKEITESDVTSLLEELHQEVDIRNAACEIDLSIASGYAIGQLPETNLDVLLKQADHAMYQNKALYKKMKLPAQKNETV